MNKITASISTQSEFDALLEESKAHAVVLCKFSPICPVSFAAKAEVESFLENYGGDAAFYSIDVIAARPLARGLAEQIGVRHESPQVILFRESTPVWYGSHNSITQDRLSSLGLL